jgi:Tol biopolymer transport system component
MARKITLAIALALALAPSAGAVPQGSTTLIDRPSGFGALPYDGQWHTNAGDHSLSADGCFVVFMSESDALLPTDENSATNVYRLNRCSPGTPPQQVNATAGGEPAAAQSYSNSPTISADGRYVAFMTDAPNLVPATDGREQVAVKDMATGAVSVVSRGDGTNGAPSADAGPGVISGNGQVVAFLARGPLDAENVDGVSTQYDLFIRNLATGRTTMVSLAANNTPGGGTIWFDISHGGDSVAFVSNGKLTADDADTGQDAYLRRGIGTSTPSTRLVSFAGGQTAGADSATGVAIAGDGGAVAFTNDKAWITTCPQTCSAATRLDKENTGGSNTEADATPFFAQTSGAAPARVFWITASALDPADTNGVRDIYGAPVGGGPVALVSGGEATVDIHGGDATAGAGVVILSSNTASLPGGGTGTQAFERTGGKTRNLAAVAGLAPRPREDGDAELGRLHAVSDDGRMVAFTSTSLALGAPPRADNGGRLSQVFVRDVVTGATALASVGPGDVPLVGREPSIDAAGRKVAFTGGAGDVAHVYVRDVATGTTVQVDRALDGAEAPQISGDGTKVVFISKSADLPGGGSGTPHAYLADLTAGTVELVDRAPNGDPSGGAHEADLSHDGSRVAFVGRGANLGGPSPDFHVYVRDVKAGTTTWASVAPEPVAGGSESLPSLSADGTRLAFVQSDPVGPRVAYVRDLARETTVPASTAGPLADYPSLSRDGAVVAFVQGLAVFVRDLSQPGQARVDLRDGSGAPGRFGGYQVSLSGNGRCAAFASHSDDLVAPSYGPDGSHLYLRAVSGDCPGGAGGPGSGPGRDTTAPVIGRARLTAKRFSLAKRKTARAAKRPRRKLARGTKFVFSLSEDARTRITIVRKRTRIALTRSKTRRGLNRIAFSGRVGKKKLRPGVYKATLVATDAAGNRSKPKRLSFRVVSR